MEGFTLVKAIVLCNIQLHDGAIDGAGSADVGADMVGMSTVPESIAGNHFGLKVMGVSCITNMAAGLGAEKLDHADILEVL